LLVERKLATVAKSIWAKCAAVGICGSFLVRDIFSLTGIKDDWL